MATLSALQSQCANILSTYDSFLDCEGNASVDTPPFKRAILSTKAAAMRLLPQIISLISTNSPKKFSEIIDSRIFNIGEIRHFVDYAIGIRHLKDNNTESAKNHFEQSLTQGLRNIIRIDSWTNYDLPSLAPQVILMLLRSCASNLARLDEENFTYWENRRIEWSEKLGDSSPSFGILTPWINQVDPNLALPPFLAPKHKHDLNALHLEAFERAEKAANPFFLLLDSLRAHEMFTQIKSDPNVIFVIINPAKLFYDLAQAAPQEKLDFAIECLKKVWSRVLIPQISQYTMEPFTLSIHKIAIALGRKLLMKGSFSEAIAYYTEAVSHFKENTVENLEIQITLYNEMIGTYNFQGNSSEAKKIKIHVEKLATSLKKLTVPPIPKPIPTSLLHNLLSKTVSGSLPEAPNNPPATTPKPQGFVPPPLKRTESSPQMSPLSDPTSPPNPPKSPPGSPQIQIIPPPSPLKKGLMSTNDLFEKLKWKPPE